MAIGGIYRDAGGAAGGSEGGGAGGGRGKQLADGGRRGPEWGRPRLNTGRGGRS